MPNIGQRTHGEVEALAKENVQLRERLETDAVRFNHCAEMIATSFSISGTLRAERAAKAEHYALETLAALKEPRA